MAEPGSPCSATASSSSDHYTALPPITGQSLIPDRPVREAGVGEGLFAPDCLAFGGVAGAPSLGELSDDEQAASPFVDCAGVAQLGEVALSSWTSQVRVWFLMRRSRRGGAP